MNVSKIDIMDLAERLEERKNSGSRIALILGSRAGALFRSKDFPEEMAPYSTRKSFSVDTNEIGRFSECYDLLKKAKSQEAPGDLEKLLNEQIKNTEYSFADECMADLVKQKIFKVVLSFNPDDILYGAFTAAALKKNEDFVEIDFDRFGRYTVEEIRNHTKRACAVIKLFNDVYTFVRSLDKPRVQEEVSLWVRNLLEDWKIKEVLLVGIDLKWDHIILSALSSRLKTILFVNEDEPGKEEFYASYKELEKIEYIAGGKGEYEKFLQMLYWHINTGLPPYRYELAVQLKNEVNAMQGDIRRIKNDVEKIRSDQDIIIRNITKILQLLEEKRP
jgi:hypothetical protein